VDTGRGEDRSLFSEHAYFTHFLISLPVYYLFPKTLTLFSIATIHILVGLIIVFFLAQMLLKNIVLAWICYFLFLMNTFILINAGCLWPFGFHSEVYYLPYFLGLLYFWDRNKKIALACFFLALLTKETYTIPLFLTMFYFLIKNKREKRTAITLMAVSFLYFILATKWLIPFFGSGKTAYNYYALRFDALRTLDLQMFLKLFLHYWKLLLIHFHFLPVFSPQILVLGLPDSLINTLSRFVLHYNIPPNPASWHSIPVLGFLIWTYLETFRKLTKLLKKQIFVYLFSLVLISFSVYLFLDSPIPRLTHYKGNKNLLISLKEAKKIMTNSNSLCVEWDLAGPFMQKRYLYNFPVNYQKAEYILLRPSDKNFSKIKDIHYEIILKTPQLVLLKKLDTGQVNPRKKSSREGADILACPGLKWPES
jgi:uncharacterized membrane protein